MVGMPANNDSGPATHLGRQMKRDRLAHGWSLREMHARTEVHIGTLSQVENGKRPMTGALAAKCDEVFPERRGWYATYYEESKSWVPAGFRSWAEYEDRATVLHVWSPGIIDGFLQTTDYARTVLSMELGATAEQGCRRSCTPPTSLASWSRRTPRTPSTWPLLRRRGGGGRPRRGAARPRPRRR